MKILVNGAWRETERRELAGALEELVPRASLRAIGGEERRWGDFRKGSGDAHGVSSFSASGSGIG